MSVKYRTMVWWKAAALMLAETISLGVSFGFASAMASHGILPPLTSWYTDPLHPIRVCLCRNGCRMLPGYRAFHARQYPHTFLFNKQQGLGVIATATGYMIGTFKLRYPHVHNMADAGEIIAGPIGREILGAAQVIFIVFICASHVLTGLIAFDTSTS